MIINLKWVYSPKFSARSEETSVTLQKIHTKHFIYIHLILMRLAYSKNCDKIVFNLNFIQYAWLSYTLQVLWLIVKIHRFEKVKKRIYMKVLRVTWGWFRLFSWRWMCNLTTNSRVFCFPFTFYLVLYDFFFIENCVKVQSLFSSAYTLCYLQNKTDI